MLVNFCRLIIIIEQLTVIERIEKPTWQLCNNALHIFYVCRHNQKAQSSVSFVPLLCQFGGLHTRTHARTRACTHLRTRTHARLHAPTHAPKHAHTHVRTHASTFTPFLPLFLFSSWKFCTILEFLYTVLVFLYHTSWKFCSNSSFLGRHNV